MKYIHWYLIVPLVTEKNPDLVCKCGCGVPLRVAIPIVMGLS